MSWRTLFKRNHIDGSLTHFTFSNDREYVMVKGNALLDPYEKGRKCGEGVYSFCGKTGDHTWILVNTHTGHIRKFLDADGRPLLGESDILPDRIRRELRHTACLDSLSTCYGFGLYSDFRNGYTALSWTLYPDGRYFADADGYGMEDNDEENAYCIINTALDIVVPFQPMRDVDSTLAQWRTGANAAENTPTL